MKLTASHLVLVMLALLTAGCAERPSGSVSVGAAPVQAALPAPLKLPAGKPIRVLFIGNSLTAANNLPALVQAMTASGKVRLEYEACTPGGVNLQDHWSDGRCRKLLAGSKWDYVVLQQGPSSLPENRANLREWAVKWAEEVRRTKAKPALYMVWPYRKQKGGFALVVASYRSAAEAARAKLLPAGEAWRDITVAEPTIALYQPDQLHPTTEGSYLAALVITQHLAGVKADSIPTPLSMPAGGVLEISKDHAKRLQQAAEKAQTAARDKTSDMK